MFLRQVAFVFTKAFVLAVAVANSIASNSGAGERSSVGAFSRVGCECPTTWREHNDNRAELDAIVEVDDVLVGHADTAR